MLLFGAIAAMVLSGFALLERAASIGNGFLVLEFVAIGVLICIPLSIAAACWVFFRPGKSTRQLFSQNEGGAHSLRVAATD